MIMDKYKERLVKGRPGGEVFAIMAIGAVLIAAGAAVMLLVHAAGFLLIPIGIVLIYQGWCYWVFRHRVTGKDLKAH